jgi:glycosyltransferase involved in cell wall biosynthesis
MDLCASMFLAHMPAATAQLAATSFCPPFCRRLGRLSCRWRNADRLFNRFWDYPRFIRRIVARFDLFHLVDHSYSQLVHVLPAGRAGVYCHDLDTFRCLLEPNCERRPFWFRTMTRRILDGFRKAAVVFYTTDAVRQQIVHHGLIDPGRLVHAPNGVAPEFTSDPLPDDADAIPDIGGRPFFLHVGSCIPRKRIGDLLDVFAAVRARRPHLRLIQVGGEWTAAQREQVGRLGIGPAVYQLRGLARPTLAALYRRAELVLLPSEAEGFGLPVVEALACGTGVVASDIPPLREVGGDAVVYCPVGDVSAWVEIVTRLLDHPTELPAWVRRRERASHFSWVAQARIITAAYLQLFQTGLPAPS